MILSVCENPTVLEVMRIVRIGLLLIRIIVPIILIISLLINYTRAVSSGDSDALAKTNKSAVSKGIAALLVFFIPTFVNIIAGIADVDQNSYLSCLGMSYTSNISEAYQNLAENYMSTAYSTLNANDYQTALNYINTKVNDPDKKQQLLNELTKIEPYVKIMSEINNLKTNYNSSTYSKLQTEINNISDYNIKSVLARELLSTYQAPSSNNNRNSSSNSQTNNNSNSQSNNINYNTGNTIFLGDSRTNGMKSKINSSTEIVIAKDGANYYNLADHLEQAKSILSKSNNSYNIVLNYGVNDLRNIESYCSKYNEFINSISRNHKIFIESVNPVNETLGTTSVTNSKIESFNNRIKSCVTGNNVYYCDVYSKAILSTWNQSYIKTDGIHYTSDGYQFIYNNIKNCIGSK